MTSFYFFQVPMLKDIKSQVPQVTCELVPSNVQRNVIINRSAAPFDKPEMRRAVALTLDRQAFIDTLTQGFELTTQFYKTPETKAKPVFSVTDQNMKESVELMVEYGGLEAKAKDNPKAFYTNYYLPK